MLHHFVCWYVKCVEKVPFRKSGHICCHAYRVNRVWEEAENRWVNRLTIEPQTFCGLKEIELKTGRYNEKTNSV